VEYTDARCPGCDTWQTVLVGYDGTQICLSCGEPIGGRRAPAALTPLSGLGWLAESWIGGGDLTHEQRRIRLRAWLKANDIGLSDELVGVLAYCDSASEVRFALPIVTLSTWRVVGERAVSDGNWTLRVQHPVGGYRAHFVLQGGERHRALVIEIDGPQRSRSERRKADHLRTLDLQAQGYLVLRVPSGDAEERGLTFRRALYHKALQVVEHRSTTAPEASAASTEIARSSRVWHPHELVYDAHDQPLEQRRELVEDWLRSRRVVLAAWQYGFLAHCHRAAEVHFAIPFLCLPNAEPVDERTVHLDPWHTLRAQVEVDDYTVDFLFMTVLEEADEVASTLIDIHPARGARDRTGERTRLNRWKEQGWHVLDLSAVEARSRGERWAASLLREVQWRREKEAG
jgi:very-short-patch-repair endonuclease